MVKNLPANAGDTGDGGSTLGWRRCPGGGNGNPLQYSCLENSMDRVHGVAKHQIGLGNCVHTQLPWAGKGKGEGISKWVAFAHFKMFVLARYLPIRIWAEITMEKHTYSVYYYRIFLKSLLTLLPYYFCLILGYLAVRLVGSELPKQGSNAYPLHWKVQSEPLDHQGIPCF